MGWFSRKGGLNREKDPILPLRVSHGGWKDRTPSRGKCSASGVIFRLPKRCLASAMADYAEGTGIRFRENAEHWNKNIIARMLDDERYWSAGDFPPIVSKEIGTQVTSMRKTEDPLPNLPSMFIQKKLVCSHCGEVFAELLKGRLGYVGTVKSAVSALHYRQ